MSGYMDLAKFIMVIILQYILISNHYVKLMQHYMSAMY